jgi:pyruvate dehydrogenase E2 component (dihydrolipoamide acetyltransferase)
MPTPLVMPKLGLTMQEGTVLEWRSREGDSVRRGEIVLVIESEKVEFEVETSVDGVLRKHVVAAGETVPCGQVVAVLTDTPDEPLDIEAFLAELEAQQVAARKSARAARGEGRERAQRSSADRVRASPRAKRLARLEGVDLAGLEGTGPGGRIGEEDVRRAVAELGTRIAIGEARIGYAEQGQGDPPATLLIGFGLDRSGWNLQLRDLAADRRVIAPDPRGTGTSTDPGDEPLVVQRLARDVIDLFEARGIERADLIGSSLGSAVALEAAISVPDRVRRVVLISPAVEPDARLLAALDSFARVAEAEDATARLRVMVPWLFGRAFLADAEATERAIRAMAGVAARIPARTLRRQAAALSSWLGTRGGEIAKLRQPVLVIVGSEDILTPPANAQALAAAIPQARLEVIDGAAHAPMVEAPDRLHALLRHFLDASL